MTVTDLDASPEGSLLALSAGCDAAAALAAFVLLVSRYHGDDEVELRVRVAGGDTSLRVDLSGNLTARALVARAGEVLAGACAFEAEPAGGGSGLPAVGVLRVEGLASGSLACDAARLDARAAARLRAHFGVLVGALAAAPERGVLELPLLTPEERAERVRWNSTEGDLPHGVRIHQAFERRVDAAPGAVAILHGEEAVTYGQLEARANRLASYLRRRGVGPESRVGICVERGPRVLEAILGVLKAGGAYVPLDPAYPPERLAHMMRTAGVRVLVTEAEAAASLPGGPERILLDRDAAAVAAEPAARPCDGAAPGNLAYVIFTSGSTGQPKGIELRHRGVMNNLADLNERHGVGPDDRVLLLSSLSFDMSVYETLGILAAGGAVVVPLPRELRDPAAWASLCRRHCVTIWNSAPALLGMMTDYAEAFPAEAPETLRLAFLGGDWVPVSLVSRVRAWAPAMRDFIVMGGATEASIHSLIFSVGEVDPAWRSIPYGAPMTNQRARVLDRHLRELPVGVAGELFLGGIGLARGYSGRAAFTAERFLPDPHGEPGARLYRTGDLARYFEDGTIELLGRIDHQVKIRGFRIEPGEIEAALLRHPGVARAVVTAHGTEAAARLVAYLVRAEGAGVPATAALRATVREVLPDYMVPAAYVVLDRLPLSPNGKVDRKQLPPPPAEGERASYVAPRTPTEAAVAEIWTEVLGVAGLGAGDDFFALGGSSLSATQVVSRLRGRLGVEPTARAVFDAPTVAALADAVDALRRGGLAASAPVVPVARAGGIPLSFAQERLWFLDRLQPGSAAYNIPEAVCLRGALDRGAMEWAVGEIVRRHEALRTVFREVDGVPTQVIVPFGGFALPVHDLSSLGGAEREAEARRRAAEDAAQPFDLTAGPLFRAALLRLEEDAHILLFDMHHAVGDGWSTGVFLRELAVLYGAFRDGAASPLAELPVQYADYAIWQRERLRGAALEPALAYWRARLAGAPERMELPTDRARPATRSPRGARERASLPAGVLDALRALGERESATQYMVFLAAFQLLLSRYGAGEDLVVGTPVAGRMRAEVEGVIGLFVNTLALRTDLSGDPSFREMVRRVRAATLDAYEHQEVPFERVVEAVRPERSLAHAPLFQVMFALNDAEGPRLALPGLEIERMEVEGGTSQFDLTLDVAVEDSVLHASLEYATDLFDRATAMRMLGHLERVLERVAYHPDARLSEVELLGDAERRRILEEWSGTQPPLPDALCVHRLFEARAARTPEAVALVHDGGTLTYRALNERANQLAHRLIAAGVGTEIRVGLCAERSPGLVVGILAVLKAGGVYVPLDPAHPSERLAFMVHDSGVRLLLAPRHLSGRLPAGGPVVVALDDDFAGERVDDPRVPLDGGALAYLLYTSGSTGTPKGVAVEHRSLAAFTADTVTALGVAPSDRVLQLASAGFDIMAEELFPALARGAAVVLPPHGLLDTAELASVVERHGVTWMDLPTAYWDEWVRHLGRTGGRPPASLRFVVAGGERMPRERLAEWAAFGLPLAHLYGVTEATVNSTAFWLDGGDDGARWPTLPIGRPFGGARAYVLDVAMRPVPAGVPGELWIGGAGVARGYLGRPRLTAERFLPDPFSGREGARLYRTGDRARWLVAGDLEFLGRIDHQVKIRGVRIEPGEVEAVLAAHPGVREAAVLSREDASGERRLVAYMAGEAGADALRTHLRERLPEALVPSAFVPVDALPRTPNGKLDRAALPEPPLPAGEGGYVAPRTADEVILAEIWADILGIDRVGAHDSFFDLGGHSLMAMRMASRVRSVFGIEVSVRAIFEHRTVHALARLLSERAPAAPAPPAGASADDASAGQRLLAMLKDLPEEELDRLLAAQP